MKQVLKRLIFGLLRKDPDAIVVSFLSGQPEFAARMLDEVRTLVPDRRHFAVSEESGSTLAIYLRLRRQFRQYRIGLAPVLFTNEPVWKPLRRAAFLLAPLKILAYNARLQRHHLRLRSPIASFLFLRGVPLDRIWLRPKWLFPWKRDRSVYPSTVREIEVRPFVDGRKRVAIVTPYFPFPLSHGGAVRIFNLLREIAVEFDLILLAFNEEANQDAAALPCARVILVDKPRYREPRWSTLLPPQVLEYRSPAMREALARARREYNIDAIQIEYTALAPYHGDILVEHDVTFSLYNQVHRRKRSVASWWDAFRWRRFERKWLRRYPRVVAMSEQDRALIASNNAIVIPNGVDLDRFRPEIERPGNRILFIGSFRHFPNIVAFRFFIDHVWPRLRDRVQDARMTVVAGPEPLLYWREYTGLLDLPHDARVTILGFVSDVQPLYVETNLVIVPTLVSAGTNLKVLEALAMDRAVVSTSSGCAGLGLEHGATVWIADSADEFACGITALLGDHQLRQRIAAAGRRHAEHNFDWRQIGSKQRGLLRELTGGRMQIRSAIAADLDRILEIQTEASESSQWDRDDYLAFDCDVAVVNGVVAGFVVSRRIDEGEREILNVAVHPDMRRSGIASELVRSGTRRWPGTHFLEVRDSNKAARQLYRNLGFKEVGIRQEYYDNPTEAAIVMRIYS